MKKKNHQKKKKKKNHPKHKAQIIDYESPTLNLIQFILNLITHF